MLPARSEQSGNPNSPGLRLDQVEDPDLSGQKVDRVLIIHKYIKYLNLETFLLDSHFRGNDKSQYLCNE